jgi:uncharacterized membrane protein YecN with MAPEG domain/dihydrofolate reductase
MRKLIASTFVSLDGVMQAPGGPEEDPTGGFSLGDWMFGYADESMDISEAGFDGKDRELVLGRRTYDIFAAYWPYQPHDHPIANTLNAAKKHVASPTLTTLDWNNSVLLQGDVRTAITALKARSGPDLQIIGSGGLIRTLQAASLIDRYNVWTFPVVLGPGQASLRRDCEAFSASARSLPVVDERRGHEHLCRKRRHPAWIVRERRAEREGAHPTQEDGRWNVVTSKHEEAPRMRITAFYAALLALLFGILSVRTLLLRRRLRVAVGDASDAQLLRAMRVHANFAEYVPLCLLLVAFCEAQGTPAPWVHLALTGLLVGRLVHAYGVQSGQGARSLSCPRSRSHAHRSVRLGLSAYRSLRKVCMTPLCVSEEPR